MGNYEAHTHVDEHLEADAKRHAIRLETEPTAIPRGAVVEDLYFRASNRLDWYLSFLGIHPFERAHREEILEGLATLNSTFVSILKDYRQLSSAIFDVAAGRKPSAEDITKLNNHWKSLEYYVRSLPIATVH